MINQCLTGKTSGFDRPRYPVLQILWGIITSTNVDYAELIWEEFVQAIQTFLTDKANLGSPTKKGKKDKPHVIPYCRFTKLIICHLGRKHNLHQRSESPLHLAEEDHRHGNLKFVPKGEDDEVFGMQIPNELITNNIRNAPYFNADIEMVAKHDQKTAAAEGGKKKSATKVNKSNKPATAKQLKPKPTKEKSSKPAPAPKPKVTKEKPSQPSPLKNVHKDKVLKKVRKEKGPLMLVDEEEERRTLATKEASTGPSTQPQDDTSANIVRDSPSPADAETGADTDKRNIGGDTKILLIGEEQDEGQAGSDPGTLDEGQARSDPGTRNEGQAGSDPGTLDEGQAGSVPGTRDEGQAGTNPDDVAESLPL
ncbi:hypothetical protein Tco_1512573, partial [Tanacetum coccineum]